MLKNYPITISHLPIVIHNNPSEYSPEVNKQVDAIWQSTLQTKKELFNGKIVSVSKISHTGIECYITEYKFFIAQQSCPSLYQELNIQPLAVSGILECNNEIVFGKRANHLTQDANKFECVPSGGIDGSHYMQKKTVDYLNQLLLELTEEIGLTKNDITDISTLGIIHDKYNHVIDIGIHLKSTMPKSKIIQLFNTRKKKEYTELQFIHKSELNKPDNLSKFTVTTQQLIHLFNI